MLQTVMLKSISPISVPLVNEALIFNGIQTSAEQPPVYWFSEEEIIGENQDYITVNKAGKVYQIEKAVLKPYFKPTKLSEKGHTTHDLLETKKMIIFPYDTNGNIYSIEAMWCLQE